jgi:hypothetical protein
LVLGSQSKEEANLSSLSDKRKKRRLMIIIKNKVPKGFQPKPHLQVTGLVTYLTPL